MVADSKQNSMMEKAEMRFVATQKKMADRSKATMEHQNEAKARDAKTLRLRALRLARDEELRAAEALNPPAPKKKSASRGKSPATKA